MSNKVWLPVSFITHTYICSGVFYYCQILHVLQKFDGYLPSPEQQETGQEETAAISTRGGLGWILWKIYAPKGLLSIIEQAA